MALRLAEIADAAVAGASDSEATTVPSLLASLGAQPATAKASPAARGRNERFIDSPGVVVGGSGLSRHPFSVQTRPVAVT
jgi:hypothetical protein